MPGGKVRRGIAEHLIHCALIFRPLLPVPPVLLRDLPLLFRYPLPGLKSPKLLLIGDMDPEFHDHCSPLPEPALEIIDLPISPLPVRCLAEALDPLHEDSSVPAPVKDRDVSVLRKPLPEAPEKVALFFLGRGARDRMDDIAPRIQCSGKALDIPSLPRGIPSLIGDEKRNPVQIEAVVIFRETLLLPFKGCSVLCLIQLYGEIVFR